MLEVASDQAFPRVRQISFFLPNRVGSLQRVIRGFDEAEIRVCGLSILDAHDHAVVRIVVDQPDKAIHTLDSSGHAVCTTSLLGVCVPPAKEGGVSKLLGRLLRAELNVQYAYALLVRRDGQSIVALHVEDPAAAAEVLRQGRFVLVGQRDLEDADLL